MKNSAAVTSVEESTESVMGFPRSIPHESLAAMFEAAPIGVVLLNAGGYVSWANAEFSRILGLGAEECSDRSLTDLFEPAAGAEQVTTLLPAVHAAGPAGLEISCRRRDGTRVALVISGGPLLHDVPGHAAYYLVRDVTGQRRAEAECAHAASLYRATLESTADGLLVVDDGGRALSHNQRFLDLWRIPEALVTHGTDADLLAFVLDQVEDAPGFLRRVEELYANAEESSYDEIRFKDGRIFERYSQPQRVDGKSAGRVWSFRDITDRKRAEEALLFSEDKFAKAFRSSPLRVSISTVAEGRFVEVNDTFLHDHGFTRDEVIGRTSPELGLWADPSERRRLIDAIRREGVVREFEYSGQLRDGRVQITSLSAEIIQVGGEPCLLAVATDITARKEAEAKARRSRRELRDLAQRLQSVREEERARIAREIHDELGQALTGLKIDLAWVKRRVEDRPELPERLQSIMVRIDGTIDSVRRIATELRPSVLDHLGLVAAVEWQAQEFERRTGIMTALEVRSAHTEIDDARATTAFRILQETLTNVARHARATRVDVALSITATELELRVSDNGRGITPAEIAAPRSLGLVGLRERAIACGGTLRIEGVPERGTHVSVRVPLAGTPMPVRSA